MKTLLALFTKFKYLLLSLVFAFIACWPLFHAGLPPTHDGEYHLIRFFEFDKTLREGNLYPRWAPDLNFGYGIPLFTYVYPLPNYVASLFHSFGSSFLDSVKLNMIAATLLGAGFFYLWAKKFWGELGGFVSSVFYTYAPYHFVDIFIRGSVGEVWALGVLPGFLWTYTEFLENKRPIYGIFSVLFLSLTIFSHNIVGLMLFTFALSYMGMSVIFSKEKKSMLFSSLSIVLLSLGISAIFWIPALFETEYVRGLQVFDLQRNFPDLFQLLFPSWGTGFFDSNLGDEMSVQIGIANLLGIILAIISLFIFLKKKRKQAKTIAFFLSWFVVVFFLMLPVSLTVWQHVPLVLYFQFPWRFLCLMILLCSFLTGSILLIKPSKILAGVLIAIAIATTISSTTPAYYMMRNDTYYVTRSNFIDSTNSPGNVFNTIWNTAISSRPKEPFLILPNVDVLSFERKSSTNFFIKLKAKQQSEQSLAVSYFPGWHITLDGKSIQPYPKNGLLTFAVPVGQHSVSIQLLATGIQTIATWISIFSLLFVFALFILRRKISTLLTIWAN